MMFQNGPLRAGSFAFAAISIVLAVACAGPQGPTSIPIEPHSSSGSAGANNVSMRTEQGRLKARYIDGCLSITPNGANIDPYNQPGYTNNDYQVHVRLPSSSGTVYVSATQDLVTATAPPVNVVAGQSYLFQIGVVNYGQGQLPYAPCNGSFGASWVIHAYNGSQPLPTPSGGYGTVDFEPTSSPTSPPPTLPPGPLHVFPASGAIDYPKGDNELSSAGCTFGQQPYIPGLDSDDPDAVVSDNVRLRAPEGCEQFNGLPLLDKSEPSVHITEKNYYGEFKISGQGNCDPALGGPQLWDPITKKPLPIGTTAYGPSTYLMFWGTNNVVNPKKCSISVTSDKGKSLTITVYPGTT